MLVVINHTDNPWLVVIFIFIQFLLPAIQNGQGVLETENLFIYLIAAGFVVVGLIKFYKNVRSHGFREAVNQIFQLPAHPPEEREPSHSQEEVEQFQTKVMRNIQSMPMEQFKTPDEIHALPIPELQARLKKRGVQVDKFIEREELVSALKEFRGGPSNNDTCCICCDEYNSGDDLRILRNCKHEFHLDCLDKWAYISANNMRNPTCPLCNQPLA